jgi:hypothetical protein
MAGKKTFVAGEVLTAQDVNDYLMDQSVMNFASSAARASAIPTPTEGMVTYRADADNLELYNGSDWKSATGLVHIKTETFSGVASQSINDVFSANFDNYRAVLKVDGTASGLISFRLRVSGSDATGSNYEQQGVRIRTGTIANPNGVATITSFSLLDVTASTPKNGVSFDLISPFLAENTQYNSAGFEFQASSQAAEFRAGNHNLNTSYTGLTILPASGNITGTISIYGYGK